MSLIEAIANVVVGYGIAVLTQYVFPWFGLPARVGDALAIGAVFTVLCGSRIRWFMRSEWLCEVDWPCRTMSLNTV